MRKLHAALIFSAVIFSSTFLPANAQSYDNVVSSPWVDFLPNNNVTTAHPSMTTGQQAWKSNSFAAPVNTPYTSTGAAANQSVNPAAYSSGQFNLGFAAPGPQTGAYAATLPPVATSSVNLSICDAAPATSIASDPYDYTGQGSNSDPAQNLPPSPGPGYQPIMQHGVFVGYMSPELINMMQSDPYGAWTQFANSADFVGPEGLRLSLLAETGAASPEQMAQLESMALFGM